MDVENSKSFVESYFLQKEDLWFRSYEAFCFKTQFGQPKNFLFVGFFGQFFCNIFSKNINSMKVPNDPSCSIHIFYKDRLQSLTKKKVSQWLKKI